MKILFILAALSLLAVLFSLIDVCRKGIALRERDLRVSTESHKRSVMCFLTAVVFAVFFVEVIVRTSGGAWGNQNLRYVHYTLVGLTVLFLVLSLWFNGVDYPEVHWKMVRSLGAFLSLTFITGTALFLQHPYFS